MTAATPHDPSRPLLYLIDGSAYIYRAFYALPALTNSKGLQTNAIYGFTTMLAKILREQMVTRSQICDGLIDHGLTIL